MRVHVTLFLLTILLEFVFGMWKEGPSTSYSQNVMEQGVQRAMNVQGRGGRLPIGRFLPSRWSIFASLILEWSRKPGFFVDPKSETRSEENF